MGDRQNSGAAFGVVLIGAVARGGQRGGEPVVLAGHVLEQVPQNPVTTGRRTVEVVESEAVDDGACRGDRAAVQLHNRMHE